jgi:predicted  nucleic acid-binding Zn-ribbon protein
MSTYSTDDARLARLEEIVSRLSESQKEGSEFLIEAKTRLGNGQKAFDDLHKRMSDVETQTRPNVSRIVSWLATALMTVGSMAWAGAMMAAERPTFLQTKEIVANARAEQAHISVQQRLEEHERLIHAITSKQDRFDVKLDTVLSSIDEFKAEFKAARRR